MSATADPAHDSADHGGHDEHHDPNLAHHFNSMEQQFESGKLGMWVFLATEILMFGGLFCAYAIYRGNNPEIFLFAHQALDTNLGAINTAVLLASSFTMAVGVKAASQGKQKLLLWMLAVTFLGGIGFMTIKTVEYAAKWDKGLWVGPRNVFYGNSDGFETPEKKRLAEDKAIDYIENHGHESADHGKDGHGKDDHSKDGHAAEAETGDHAEHGSAEEHHAEAQEADAHETEAQEAEVPEPTAALAQAPGSVGAPVWPPVPADRMSLPAPVNQAAATRASFLNPAPVVGTLEGMISGSAKQQVQEADGPKKYPGFENLSPLDQERTHIFFQIYFVMTGLHGLHVLIGMGLIAWVFLAAIKSPFGPSYYAPVDIVGLYWHLVDLIWIFLFPLLYLIH